jgi:hypothetical protein
MKSWRKFSRVLVRWPPRCEILTQVFMRAMVTTGSRAATLLNDHTPNTRTREEVHGTQRRPWRRPHGATMAL